MIILKQITVNVKDEDLTAQINGSLLTFTALNNYKSGSLTVHLAGLEQRKGFDYVEVSPNQFTFIKAPKIGMTLLIEYTKN